MNFTRLTTATFLAASAAAILITAPAFAAAQKLPAVAGDGVKDDTAALQAILDETGKTGGQVELAAGRYLIKGFLTIPTGVTLKGTWEAPHHGVWDKGTTLLLTAGRGHEDGPASISLKESAAIKGVTMIWPEEKAENIVPYPWAIRGTGMHNTVENVTLVNAYQGIKIGDPWSELHFIRNVFGCVLRRGIFIDSTSDIGRIENVHFNTHYWIRSRYPGIQAQDDGATGKLVTGFAQKNLEAFIFGRTDWEYVANTFVWGAKIGYKFIHTKDGECNGQFMGIGADACDVGLQIDAIQSIGIQVTNGEFTAFEGPNRAGVLVSPGATGAAQFVNCNFWSTPGGAAVIHGDIQAVFNACHFTDHSDTGILQADAGSINVSNCLFAAGTNAITLKPGVKAAIVTGNLQPGGLNYDNRIGEAAQFGLNQKAAVIPEAVLGHYRVGIGSANDAPVVGVGWYDGEGADDAPAELNSKKPTARWSNGHGTLHLPVKSGSAYTLTVWLLTRPGTPAAVIKVPGVADTPIAVGKTQKLTVRIPASATQGAQSVNVSLDGPPWTPRSLIQGSADGRNLGVRVFAVDMKADGGPDAAAGL